jgi:hypothetical protein
MASEQEHHIVTALTDLIAKVGALTPSDAQRDVVAAVEDLRETLGTVGYHVGRPAWMGTGLGHARSADDSE